MKVVVVTGGHPFEPEPFFEMFDRLEGVEWRHLSHPDAYPTLLADGYDEVDALVFYDMPGIEFTGADPPVRLAEPPEEVAGLFDRLIADGVPMVFLHHAIASWPAWPWFAEMLGGRFHYEPGEFDGTTWPSSGYRFDVTQEVDVVAPDHPVCRGLGGAFTIIDEAYLFPVMEDAVTPLLRSRARFRDDEFYSAGLAIRGERDSREGWSHPKGSDLVGWTRRVGASTLVYLQFGDGPSAYADRSFQRLLANSIEWAATTRTRDLPAG